MKGGLRFLHLFSFALLSSVELLSPPPPVARVEDYPPAICRAAKLDDVYVNPIIRDLVKPSKLAIDWKAVQANDESEEAELRELGSLFCLDYEDEED